MSHTKRIILSPYSRPLRNGQQNPKNYPWWPEVVALLVQDGWEVIQIGVTGDESIPGVAETKLQLSLEEIRILVANATLWMSVDNFLPHFNAVETKKPGVVLWGKSDPKLFGYPQNKNLLKSHKYLRKLQFAMWEDEPFDANVFVEPSVVLQTTRQCAQEIANRAEAPPT